MTEYGSEYDWEANRGFLAGGGPALPGGEYYRSGRDAMKALARAVGCRRVLLPALCCPSMILPFTLNGCQVEFYRLGEDLKGDREYLLSILREGDMLLYVPYFGIRPFEDEFLRQLKDGYRGLLLAEDRTQDIIIPRDSGGFRPDATLASLRKWAALPEGGVLATELPLPESGEDPRFGRERRQAMEKKSRYLRSFQPELKKEFLEQLHRAAELLDQSGEAIGAAPEELELLRRIDFDKIRRRRLENVALLRERLEPLREAGRLKYLTERPEDSTLYFPLLLERRDEAQRSLAGKGVYCPVIWPEPEEAAGVCPVSRFVTEHMLALPCDQRYGGEDMDYIAGALSAALE